MPVKIRLSRHGRKKLPYYHIVVTDSRAPRDGRYIERIGSYNPITNPATIELNFDRALDWLQKGAQPTDTCRAILSYKGVMIKKHLLDGVRKGAITLDVAEAKFQTWMTEKDAKVKAKVESLSKDKRDALKQRIDAESKVREARAQDVAKKRAEMAAKEAKAPAEAVAEETTEAENSEA